MAVSDSTRKAIRKYDSNSIDSLRVRVPKGWKDIILEASQITGESINGMINRLLNEECIRVINKSIYVKSKD